MNWTWVDKVIPVGAVVLGWGLNEYGKHRLSIKGDKKKLKKLLFNLLEIRWLMRQELNLPIELETCLTRLREQISSEFGENIDENQFQQALPLLIQGLRNQFTQIERIEEMESRADETIVELSEIYPVLAYELSGEYRIRERLDAINGIWNNIQLETLMEEMPEEIRQALIPDVSDKLVVRLDDNIKEIAGLIGRKTKKYAIEVMNNSSEIDIEGIDEFIEHYIQIIRNIINGEDQQNQS